MACYSPLELQLQQAFIKSGLSAYEFYQHILATRRTYGHDDKCLGFKVIIEGEFGEDITWFHFDNVAQHWYEA